MNLQRRSLLAGLISVAATVYAIDPAEASIKVIRSRTIGVAGPTVTISSPIANGSPYTADFAPTYRDAYVCMSPTVAQNDERIDVQAVIGTPYTPEATQVVLSGSDAQYFDVYSGGYLVFKAATRASVPRATTLTLTCTASNANGISEICTLYVWVPATGISTNGEIFVDFANGSDANTGAFGSPFKHLPGTADYTGSAKTYTAGQTIFFAGGLHKTYLGKSNLQTQGFPPMDNQSGASLSAPIRYAFWGWGGQAKMSGARDENGAVTSATSAEAFASPSLANLKAQTVSTAIEWFQGVFWQDGEAAGYLAQYPRPTNLQDRFKPASAAAGTNGYNGTTSDGGWKQITYTTNPSDPAAVKLYYATTSSYIQDAALDAHFNNASVGTDANGIGIWAMLWDSTNNVSIVNVTSYDVTTHQATIPGCPTLSTDSGYTAYALLNSPYDVQVQGQYSGSLDGLKIISYPPASPGQVSVSREVYGAMISTNPNVNYHQLWCQGYSGGSNKRAGAANPTGGGGAAIMSRNNSNANVLGINVYGCRSHNNCNGDELALGIMATGSEYQAAGGMYQWIIHRMHYSDNWMGRGRSATAPTRGVATGSGPGGMPTKVEVADPTARNKVWWGYVAPFGCTKSVEYTTQSRGLHYKENVIRDYYTVHGDYYAWYAEDDTPGHTLFNDHHYSERDFGDNALRWKTTSFAYSYLTSGISNWYDGLIVLGAVSGTNTGLSLFSGDPSGTYTSCVFLLSTRNPGSTIPCAAFNGGFANMTVQNCILNGATTDTSTLGGVSPTWTYDSNGVTATISAPTNWPVHDAANSRIVTNTTQLSVQQTWDGVTVPAGWVSILRAGAGSVRLGPFLTV